MPRQTVSSNDCGVFLVQFMKKIVESPEDFIERATNCDFSDWFLPNTVAGLRGEISKLLYLMANEQRRPFQVLAGESLQITELKFS